LEDVYLFKQHKYPETMLYVAKYQSNPRLVYLSSQTNNAPKHSTPIPYRPDPASRAGLDGPCKPSFGFLARWVGAGPGLLRFMDGMRWDGEKWRWGPISGSRRGETETGCAVTSRFLSKAGSPGEEPGVLLGLFDVRLGLLGEGGKATI
jgi:hypothetical protein